MPNADKIKTLLKLLSEYNNRSRWYSSRIWQIPFAYLGVTAVLASLTLKQNTLLNPKDTLVPCCFFIIFGIIGLLVFVHMIGLINGEKRAVCNLRKIEEHIFTKLKNKPTLEAAKYLPVFYVWPLAFVLLLISLFILFIGFWLLGGAKVLMIIAYFFIIFGSVGIIVYFFEFPFSTDLVGALSTTGYHVPIKSFIWWIISWLLIIIGTLIQLFHYLTGKLVVI